MAQDGLPREIKYRRTPGRWNFTDEELHEDQANYAYKICAEFSPPPGNCAQDIYDFLAKGMARREHNRWAEACTPEHYRTLGLAKDATFAQVRATWRRMYRELGGNVSPYAPRNATEAFLGKKGHHWEPQHAKRWRVDQALGEIGATYEKRKFYDTPCKPLFGGAMCSRTLADGGMSILAGGDSKQCPDPA